MSGDVPTVRWITAFLDTARESAEVSETFWSRVTGYHVSPSRGERDEFATLLPATGDAHLKVQRVVQTPPGGLHLDLHTDDVRGLAHRAEDLGASASYLDLGYVVCGSPGGMTFCVVDHPGAMRTQPSTWPGGRSMVDEVCLDVPPSRWGEESEFWSALTGWSPKDHDLFPEYRRIAPPQAFGLSLLLQRLDDEQPVVTGHLDLAADDFTAEAGRHMALGARVVRHLSHWIVLEDPVGRTYCVTARTPR